MLLKIGMHFEVHDETSGKDGLELGELGGGNKAEDVCRGP